MLVEDAFSFVEVDLAQRRVGWAAAADQHVVDRRGQPGEEAFDIGGAAEVEYPGPRGVDVAGGTVEAFALATGEDDARIGRSRLVCGLQPDAGAAAQDDDGLPGEGLVEGCCAHGLVLLPLGRAVAVIGSGTAHPWMRGLTVTRPAVGGRLRVTYTAVMTAAATLSPAITSIAVW